MTNTRSTTASRGASRGFPIGQPISANLSMTVAFKNSFSVSNSSNSPIDSQMTSRATGDSTETVEGHKSPGGSDADDQEDTGTGGDAYAPPVQIITSGKDEASSMAPHGFDDVANEQVGLQDNAVMMMQPEEGHSIIFEEARRPSVSNISGSASDVSDFDIADDDDDYGAIDQLSQVSEDDAIIEASDARHMATDMDDWAAHNMDMDRSADQLLTGVNWDDHRTYDFEYSLPYSDQIPHDSAMTDPMIIEPSNGTGGMSTSNIASMLTGDRHASNEQFDPHLRPALFAEDTSASDSSSISSARSGANQAPNGSDSRSQNAEPLIEDDTDSEDIAQEIERRARLSREREKLKSANRKRSSSRRKKQNSSPLRPTHASKIQKFTRSPRRIHASPKMTARGRIICLSISNDTRIRWITGRVPVDPSATAPSPELVRHLRSRMFQQAYCLGQSTLDLLRGMPVSNGYTQAVFNQPAYYSPRLLPPANMQAGPQAMLTDEGYFDLSQFQDDDGDNGVTLDLDYVDYLNFADDVASNPDSWTRQFEELDEEDEALPRAPQAQELSDTDVETPCPKRQRTATDSMDGTPTSGELLSDSHLFTPLAAPNHLTV